MIESYAAARSYLDFSGFHQMREAAQNHAPGAETQIARQFEALFVQFAIKAMRDASFGGGLLDGNHSELYRDLLDKQIAMEIANTGTLGFAESLAARLAPKAAGDSPPSASNQDKATAAPQVLQPTSAPATYTVRPTERVTESGPSTGAVAPQQAPPREITPADIAASQDEFVKHLWPLAQRTATELNASPAAILAQAALETGWGRFIPRRQGGDSGFNLFGIKAGAGWRGDRTAASSIEVLDGGATNVQSDFRAYASFDESFADYANLLKSSPRYRSVLDAKTPENFMQGLQRAGYATDPDYANKVLEIMRGTTLQVARNEVDSNAI